jgi:phosphoglycolate phosphatase
MSFRGVVFDLDGTLADTLADLTDAVNAGLGHVGLGPQSVGNVRQWIGEGALLLCRRAIAAASPKKGVRPPLPDLLPEKLLFSRDPKGNVSHPAEKGSDPFLSDPIVRVVRPEEVDDTTLAAMASVFTAYYRAHRLDKTGPYPGIPQLLDALTARGLKLAVLSNKPHEHTVALMDALFKKWPWSVVEGGREDRPKKPDPQLTREIVARMGLQPVEVLMVGDSAPDIQAARNIGAPAVGVTWGFRTREELQAAGADHLIDHPKDLLVILS